MSEETFLLMAYERMQRIRLFEEKVDEMLKRGEISGTVHLCVGQEACAAAIGLALHQTDYLVGHHRSHGHCLMKGGDVKPMMAELYGKKTGYCKGRGGSIHLINMEQRYLGSTGIVGGGLPIAVGAAFALEYREPSEAATELRPIVACVFGDGCSNEGSFHESLNLASAWKLPVLFICENNLYGLSMPWEQASAIQSVAQRAGGYGMEGVSVDGNDFEQAYEAVSRAVETVRERREPMLLELRTYRLKGHSRSDPIRTYRTKEEEDLWRKKDPIKMLREKLERSGKLGEEIWENIAQTLTAELEEALEFARTSPAPTAGEAGDNLFAQEGS